MGNILFKTESEVTDDWVDYIANEARSVAQLDEEGIAGYIDREVLNPEVISFLKLPKTKTDLLEGVKAIQSNLALSGASVRSLNVDLPDWVPDFKKLKELVRKAFCKIVGALSDDDGIDLKDIIKAILIALIPVFAGGVPAIVLPIVIGLVAYFLKQGYEAVCPI